MNETVLAVDMGGSHVEYGIVRDGALVAAERMPVSTASLAMVLPLLEARILELATRNSVSVAETTGIAMGICAVVQENKTIAATNGKYDDGVGFSLAEWGKSRFGLRCLVENDARLALLGEHFAGAAQGFDDAALVTLGTGIGGAILLGGKLLRSHGEKAGGLAGHLVVDWQGRMCTCGNRGCAEAEASTVALDSMLRSRQGFSASALAAKAGALNFRDLFAAADANDVLAREALDRCIAIWSSLTVSLIHAYDPQIVVFGGGIMARQDAILSAIRAHVARHAWLGGQSVVIAPSALGSSAALLGAVPLLRGDAA